jgi:hypothetical protein
MPRKNIVGEEEYNESNNHEVHGQGEDVDSATYNPCAISFGLGMGPMHCQYHVF